MSRQRMTRGFRWRWLPIWVLIAACFPAGGGRAQQLAQMDFEGHPSVYLGAAGRTAGCGMRVLGVEVLSLQPPHGRTVDASFVLDSSGLATVKAASQDIGPDTLHGARPRSIKVESAWFRAPGSERTAPLDGDTRGGAGDPGSVRYVSAFKSALAVLSAITAGSEIQISVQRSDEPMHTVYYGKVAVSDSDMVQLRHCAEELVAAMKEKARSNVVP